MIIIKVKLIVVKTTKEQNCLHLDQLHFRIMKYAFNDMNKDN